ncbi:Uncharacterized conserved protein, DUF2141 family [Catalinimonas alkaloidigena]|uniref:Uncharacterized conserved protein, DUF2141 family n=1 Tax=Catalinimonas alkaloidigena TaxID=1075417 RepID=A0A1G9DLY0_9BACT|nr:DUF2141 domain-containing protein [Catalinimonas alkaloidigena]SDK64854.1 Uncharacterized conserved protein, DUF2141 family [Catalinimonas alkaloidigena]
MNYWKYLLLTGIVLQVGMARAQGTLTLEVKGLKQETGALYIALYNKPEGFREADAAYKKLIAPVKGNPAVVDLGGLPAGTYAVTLFHDENDNGELDTNMMGIPKEGYGFSNNPKIRFGPPDFGECTFTHGDAAQTVSVQIQ